MDVYKDMRRVQIDAGTQRSVTSSRGGVQERNKKVAVGEKVRENRLVET